MGTSDNPPVVKRSSGPLDWIAALLDGSTVGHHYRFLPGLATPFRFSHLTRLRPDIAMESPCSSPHRSLTSRLLLLSSTIDSTMRCPSQEVPTTDSAMPPLLRGSGSLYSAVIPSATAGYCSLAVQSAIARWQSSWLLLTGSPAGCHAVLGRRCPCSLRSGSPPSVVSTSLMLTGRAAARSSGRCRSLAVQRLRAVRSRPRRERRRNRWTHSSRSIRPAQSL
jgi:hypothetical protein